VATLETLTDYANQILEVAGLAVATTSGGAISRAFVSTNRPALDCCPQLTVDLRQLLIEQTSPNTPVPAAGQRVKLRIVYVAGYVITVVRCSSIADVAQDGLPRMSSIAQVAAWTTEDLWATWNALREAWNDGSGFLDGDCKDFYLDPPTPVSQEGGCVGWEIPVRVWVDGYTALP
jgi:hypothetical protein